MIPTRKFKWSSHQPIVKSILDIAEPKFILELGIGHFSTPLFINSEAKKIIHVENELEWLNLMVKEYDCSKNAIHHDLKLSSITKSTKLAELSIDVVNDIYNFYENLSSEITKFNYNSKLLFVDQHTCLRTISINKLYNLFDFIIYHDAEHPDTYEYDKIDNKILEQYDHYILKIENNPWTGIFMKKNLVSEENFRNTVEKYYTIFCNDFEFESPTAVLEKILQK